MVTTSEVPQPSHPEQRESELYMGNTTMNQFHASDWITKRMGHVARYADGRAIESHGWRGEETHPWFIQSAEVEQRIKGEEFAQGPNWTEKVRVYREMLTARRV